MQLDIYIYILRITQPDHTDWQSCNYITGISWSVSWAARSGSPAAKVTYETSTGDEAYDAYEVGVVLPHPRLQDWDSYDTYDSYD